MSSIKREIRHFHVVVVQKRERKVLKRVMHVRGCCFAYMLFFRRSRCRPRRWNLTSLIASFETLLCCYRESNKERQGGVRQERVECGCLKSENLKAYTNYAHDKK